ncbi:hypothetical protein [Bacillus sp. CHD6a]|uniref:hypothetical protein n=1 Tax=Bacillus sp. CHD6a TaxID=1643452 RepID=UPI0006CC8041|nr:hypothetical protein [Bacillus sp. CHD6a]KPB03080.1 hypothetical protein AAV98_19285 [Bacillus sp. CHD6a]
MFGQRIETINYKDFMRGQHRFPNLKSKKQNVYSIITVSPFALFDPLVLGVAAGILGIVLLEKFLEGSSLFVLGEYLAKFIGVICPVALFGALIYFLMTNPFILWG